MRGARIRVYPYSGHLRGVLNIGLMSNVDLTRESEPSEPVVEEGLRRSVKNRKLGGVAGGIGERFEIDANIVRVVFVILTCLWGLGAAIYLAMWALVPASGTTYASNDEVVEGSNTKRFGLRGFVLLAAALCVGLIFTSVALGGPGFGKGLSLAWLIFLVILAVLSLRRPVRRFSFTRMFAALFIAALSVVILVSGGVLAYVSSTGTPITGGIGERMYQPTSLSQIHNSYRMAFGRLTLDLRSVDFASRTVTVTSTVAIGVITIDVPPGLRVSVVAKSGSGNINYDQGEKVFDRVSETGKNTANLILKVGVGIGSVNFWRSAPGTWAPQ